MSIVDDRAEIAAALSTVDGVKGYEYPPRNAKPGDGWALLPTWELNGGLVWQAEWSVVVLLPADDRKASEWVDEHFDAIVTALRVPGFPTNAQMSVMETEAGDRSVLEITMRSE